MTKILSFLSGKKTIITGIVMIVLGILQQNEELILGGLGLIFLRAGVEKNK
jgi:hypothetical protein